MVGRKKQGISQKQLGARVGVSDKMIQAWEHGIKTPADQHMAALHTIIQP